MGIDRNTWPCAHNGEKEEGFDGTYYHCALCGLPMVLTEDVAGGLHWIDANKPKCAHPTHEEK